MTALVMVNAEARTLVTFWNVILFVVAAVLMRLAWSYYSFVSGYKIRAHIPGPEAKYPFGVAWMFLQHGRLEGWKKILEMGDREQGISHAYLPGTDMVMVSRKEHLRQIVQVSPHHFYPGRPFGQNAWDAHVLGSHSVLFTDASQHEEWVHLRRVMGKAFLTTAVKPLVHPIAEVLHKLVDVIRTEKVRLGEGKPVDCMNILSALTYDILGKCSFEEDFQALASLQKGGDKNLHPTLKAYTELRDQQTWREKHNHLHPFFSAKYLWVPTGSNRRAVQSIQALRDSGDKSIAKCRERMAKRKQSGQEDKRPQKYKSYVEILVEAADDGQLTPDQLLSNVLTILSAGHETTAMNLQYTLYELCENPDVQKRIQEEVDRVWPIGTEPNEDTAKQLEYTGMVLKEALRMHPQPYLTVRTIPKAMNVGGYELPKHTTVLIPMGLAMRDPKNWNDPDTFKPERFTKDSATENFYAWLPFMHGGRSCIGQRFAQLTTTLIVAAFVRRFEFKLPDDYKFELKSGASSSRLANGLPLLITERHKSG